MICVTLDCVGLTQSSVIRFTHQNVGLKSFFIYVNVCYCRWFFYIYISQSSIETRLGYGGIYNNHIIANCM